MSLSNVKLATSEEKMAMLRQWIDDLQSGMYINCVYCGHRYGPAFCQECEGSGISKYNPDHMPDKLCSECSGSGRTDDHVNGITHCCACEGTGEGTPVAMGDVLKHHVMHCPDHPMNAMREALEHVQTMARLALSNYPEMNEILRLQIEEIRRCCNVALTE